MASMYDIGEKGSSLVFALVVLAVLSIGVVSLLQSAAMSFGTGSFQQERQQALAAAESGIAIASAMLVGSDAPQIQGPSIPRLSRALTAPAPARTWNRPASGKAGAWPRHILQGMGFAEQIWYYYDHL